MRILLLNDCSRTMLELQKFMEKETSHTFINPLAPSGKLGRFPKNVLNIIRLLLHQFNVLSYDVCVVNNLGVFAVSALFACKPFILVDHGNSKLKKIGFVYRTVFCRASSIFYTTPNLARFLPDRAKFLRASIGLQFTDFGRVRDIEVAARKFVSCKGYSEDGFKNVYMLRWIPYEDMPAFLNRVKVFVDKVNLEALSRTGLEALACGCEVIDFRGIRHFSVPCEYQPNRQVLYAAFNMFL